MKVPHLQAQMEHLQLQVAWAKGALEKLSPRCVCSRKWPHLLPRRSPQAGPPAMAMEAAADVVARWAMLDAFMVNAKPDTVSCSRRSFRSRFGAKNTVHCIPWKLRALHPERTLDEWLRNHMSPSIVRLSLLRTWWLGRRCG